MKKLLLTCVSLLGFVSLLEAQDIHFSQIQATPTFMNPAMTGSIKGDYRASLNFKDQYSGFTGDNSGSAYRTYMASYDMALFKNTDGKKVTGIGMYFFQDVAGDSKTKTSQVNLSLSQTVHLTRTSDLTLGVSGSFLQYSANYAGLSWGSQYNGIDYDPEMATNEGFAGRAQSVFDLSAGLLFRKHDFEGNPLEIGVSAAHLNTPSTTLPGSLAIDNLPMKYVIHASKTFSSRDSRWSYNPYAFFANQRNANELNAGILFGYNLGLVSTRTSYYKKSQVFFGMGYRMGDAVIPMVRFALYEKYMLGVSYDVNISSLNNASQYRGGLEFSLTMNGLFNGASQVLSPFSMELR